ncbi:MAG: hypothetical protein JW732_03535 [Dehalococcoidia bacterium]|nr:hypothetical protein [Dehalococcoidia bacterium]
MIEICASNQFCPQTTSGQVALKNLGTKVAAAGLRPVAKEDSLEKN